MFLRSIHADSDSGDMGPGLAWHATSEQIDRQLWQRFRLRRDELARAALGLPA